MSENFWLGVIVGFSYFHGSNSQRPIESLAYGLCMWGFFALYDWVVRRWSLRRTFVWKVKA